MPNISLLGLGIMGNGMAHNLLRANYPLTVYNRTAAKAAPLAAAGAQVAASAKAAAANADIILSMVADDNASRAMWLGPEGALASAQPGTIAIESSTLSLEWVRELSQLVAAQDCHFLDAPVTGSKPQAEAGELNFFVGGDPAILEQARPVLEAVGRRIEHLGPNGSGATMKLINNLIGGVQVSVLAEALFLAQRAGLEIEQVLPLLINGAGGSPLVKGKAARIAAEDYNTQFALRWMHKDLSYALAAAAEQGLALPTVAAARSNYERAIERGFGDADFAAVGEALRTNET